MIKSLTSNILLCLDNEEESGVPQVDGIPLVQVSSVDDDDDFEYEHKKFILTPSCSASSLVCHNQFNTTSNASTQTDIAHLKSGESSTGTFV